MFLDSGGYKKVRVPIFSLVDSLEVNLIEMAWSCISCTIIYESKDNFCIACGATKPTEPSVWFFLFKLSFQP